MRILRTQLRAPADLAPAANFISPPLDVLGSIAVAFIGKATNANQLTIANIETTPDTLIAGQTWYNATSNGGWGNQGSLLGNPLNNGGYIFQIYPAVAYKPAVWRGARINITGHATLTITGFELIGIVIYAADTTIIETSELSVMG